MEDIEPGGPQVKGGPDDEVYSSKFFDDDESNLKKRTIRLAVADLPKLPERKSAEATTPAAANSDAVDANPDEVEKKQKSLYEIPRTSVGGTIWWFYTWPIRVITTCLIPNPKTYRRWYPLTFVLCIAFIGANSYLIFWMIVIIGHTFGIPEVVMGLTVLSWGSCLPEAIACILVIRTGSGGVGVSNSLGM